MRFLSGQEIKSALNSGNVCALSKKRRAMENAVEALQGRISAQEGHVVLLLNFDVPLWVKNPHMVKVVYLALPKTHEKDRR